MPADADLLGLRDVFAVKRHACSRATHMALECRACVGAAAEDKSAIYSVSFAICHRCTPARVAMFSAAHATSGIRRLFVRIVERRHMLA